MPCPFFGVDMAWPKDEKTGNMRETYVYYLSMLVSRSLRALGLGLEKMMGQFFESLRTKSIAHLRSWWVDEMIGRLRPSQNMSEDDELSSCTSPKTNMSPEKDGISKEKSSSNHHFSRAMLVFGGVNFCSCPSLAGQFDLNFGQFLCSTVVHHFSSKGALNTKNIVMYSPQLNTNNLSMKQVIPKRK